LVIGAAAEAEATSRATTDERTSSRVAAIFFIVEILQKQRCLLSNPHDRRFPIRLSAETERMLQVEPGLFPHSLPSPMFAAR